MAEHHEAERSSTGARVPGDATGGEQTDEALRHSRARLELLSRTVSALLIAPNPQTVVDQLCNDVRTFLNCAVFFNYLLDSNTRRLHFNACGGVDPRLARKVEDLELGASLCGTAARDGCRVLAENLGGSSDPRSKIVRSLGVRAYACHPLIGRNHEVFGTLSFGASNRDGFSTDDLDLMKTVTDHVATAMLRRRDEEELREQQRRLSLAMEAGTLVQWEIDLITGKAMASQQLREFFGLERDHRFDTREEWRSLVHEDDRDYVYRSVEAAKTGQEHHVEFRVRRPDGSIRWQESHGLPIADEQGRYVRLVGFARDITERKEAETQLLQAEQRLRAVLNATGVGLWLNELPLGKLTWDARTRELFFVAADDAPTIDLFWSRLHPDDREPTRVAVEEALRRNTLYAIDHRAIDPVSGRVRWIHSEGTPIGDTSGRLVRFDGVNYDITERKEFQAELERLVAERTAKLQELVGELEHFSYTITHDMRAPLRAMRGFGELLSDLCADDPPSDQRKEFLRKIMVAADRMDALITDSLSYSRAVRQELPLERVDTGKLLRGMLDSYPEFQPSRAHISIHSDLPVVLGNQAGLTQCFSNLLGNAVKFVKPGQIPEIRVWAEERKGCARIWFEDNGIGIPEAMLPRVFDMFSRGSRDFEGTGIGLALVRKVSQRMGGTTGVESEEGSGSRFWLELPM